MTTKKHIEKFNAFYASIGGYVPRRIGYAWGYSSPNSSRENVIRGLLAQKQQEIAIGNSATEQAQKPVEL
jgi:hypothetical protein